LNPNEIIQEITRRIIYKAKKTEDPCEILPKKGRCFAAAEGRALFENGRALAFLGGQVLL
jgi:hypothetical protein